MTALRLAPANSPEKHSDLERSQRHTTCGIEVETINGSGDPLPLVIYVCLIPPQPHAKLNLSLIRRQSFWSTRNVWRTVKNEVCNNTLDASPVGLPLKSS